MNKKLFGEAERMVRESGDLVILGSKQCYDLVGREAVDGCPGMFGCQKIRALARIMEQKENCIGVFNFMGVNWDDPSIADLASQVDGTLSAILAAHNMEALLLALS
jgi:hypothetical protein